MFYLLEATGQKLVRICDISISTLSNPETEWGGLYQCVQTGQKFAFSDEAADELLQRDSKFPANFYASCHKFLDRSYKR